MAQFNKNTHLYLDQAKTLFEVVMMADQYGNLVGPANPTGMAVDAFGRARSSEPVTLFDSFNRYQINSGFVSSNAANASISYNANTSTVSLNIANTAGSYAYRETTKVFAYQPGKSLQILNTFVMDPPQTGLTQRVGYFGPNNGIFLEQSNSTISFVKRSYITGSVVDTPANQVDWNLDKLDGTGPSLLTLDLTKPQIFFTDIEWLGVGSVRCGFVINGQLIHCHSFHHANQANTTGTYMTTACLPVRYEIFNTANTANSSSLDQICTSVVSEGGYELRGRPRSAGQAGANTLYDLATAGTFYPVVAIRLKSDRLDGIVVPKNISLLGVGNNTRIHWKVVSGATVSGGGWISAGSDSAVEYNANGTSMSGGTSLVQGFIGVNNQSGATATLDSGDTFKYQLERNSFTSTPTVLVLAAGGAANGDDVLGAIDWEEIT
ncbi:hypothetical protein EB118_18575 [bacterium]|nr:hypothetical protein [bacterium]